MDLCPLVPFLDPPSVQGTCPTMSNSCLLTVQPLACLPHTLQLPPTLPAKNCL